MLNSILGLILAFCIGSICRYVNLPLPAPPRLSGAMLVLAMTSGFVVAGNLF